MEMCIKVLLKVGELTYVTRSYCSCRRIVPTMWRRPGQIAYGASTYRWLFRELPTAAKMVEARCVRNWAVVLRISMSGLGCFGSQEDLSLGLRFRVRVERRYVDGFCVSEAVGCRVCEIRVQVENIQEPQCRDRTDEYRLQEEPLRLPQDPRHGDIWP